MSASRPDPHPQVRRLTRALDGRLVAGVAAGLAEHLRVPVLAVRAVFIVLTAFGGAGLVAYGALWFLAPQDTHPASRPRPSPDVRQLAALGAISVGVVAIVAQTSFGGRYLWPLVAAAFGVGLIWQQADETQRTRWRAAATGASSLRVTLLRLGLAVALIAIGLTGFLASHGQLGRAREGLLSTGVVVSGIALLTVPWIVRLARDLGAERRARIRAQEREEVAAQVHDSVLHTLALIRRNSDDAQAVNRLARMQERSLRQWLQHPNGQPVGNLAGALEGVAADLEQEHGVPVEVVAVGDLTMDDSMQPLVQATREAIVNSAKSSGADVVSVFLEVDKEAVTVFVRDRGKGFDLHTVPEDRHGISGSIIGRMRRSGGTATVRTGPGEGTEIELSLKRRRP